MSATPLPASERDRLGSIALDQWRGLALVLVLVSHGFFYTDRVNGIGRVGVNLFFFISGILVFRSLSRTRAATDWARTRSFWWRRFRRLYPALITYILAMLPIAWLCQHRPNLPPHSDFASYIKGVPLALAYTTNYLVDEPTSLGHLWSLACEMQFYLLAPVIYLLGGGTEKRKQAVFGLLLVLLMGMGAAQPLIGKWKYHFEFAVWPMMLGFCCEYKRHWFQRFSDSLASTVLWLGIAICGASLFIMLFGMEMKPVVVATGALLLAPCLMAYLFGRPMPGIAGRVMQWMGERTYSIYLWQQPFTICRFLPNALHPVGALASVPVGGVWFYCFERPFLSANRPGERRVASAGRSRWWKRLAAALGILLGAAFLLASTLRARYESQLRQQIWPDHVPEISVVLNAAAGLTRTVLLLGDSRMAQWGLPPLAHWHVVNAGTGGLTTGQIRISAPALLDQFHPDVVVLQAGINDLKFLGLRPEMTSQVEPLALSNITAIVDEGVRRHCQCILLTVWPAGKPGLARALVWSDAVPAAVTQLNGQLQMLDSAQKGIHVVDLFKAAGLKPEDEFYGDTLHLKPAAYQRLTPLLLKTMDALCDSHSKEGSPKTP
jgi:peptidoglycan/LPS O-acetylase OafA/YrhL/lysophospholipase L1-like esterase